MIHKYKCLWLTSDLYKEANMIDMVKHGDVPELFKKTHQRLDVSMFYHHWNVLLPRWIFSVVIIGGLWRDGPCFALAWDVNNPALLKNTIKPLHKDKNDIKCIQWLNIVQDCSIIFNVTLVLDIKTLEYKSSLKGCSPSLTIPALRSNSEHPCHFFSLSICRFVLAGGTVILWQPPLNGLFQQHVVDTES